MTESEFETRFMALVAGKLLAPDPAFVKAKRDVYWAMLQDIPEELWQKAVDHCLKHGTFFPSIEDLGNAAMGEHWDYNPYGSVKVPWETQLRRILAKAPNKIDRRVQALIPKF